MRGIGSREEAVARLRRLTGKGNTDDDLFLKAWKEVADRGYGRGVQIEVDFPLRFEDLTKEQLERVRNGESPLLVLATSGRGGT